MTLKNGISHENTPSESPSDSHTASVTSVAPLKKACRGSCVTPHTTPHAMVVVDIHRPANPGLISNFLTSTSAGEINSLEVSSPSLVSTLAEASPSSAGRTSSSVSS